MRKRLFGFLFFICISSFIALTGCDEEGKSPESAVDVAEDEPADPYEDYIRDALKTVNGDGAAAVATPTADPNEKDVQTERTRAAIPYVSAMESPDMSDPFTDYYDTPTPTPSDSESPTPTEDPNATPTPTPTPYITPDEFEVGKCCIYINGESDSAYGTEVITAINKARTDLGYKEFVTNKGLSTCADRRTRELAALYSHTRPNMLPFYSLAPEHFKAEMLVINNQKAEDTVDIMIKKDPVSRNLIFSEKYQSIGASSFKCNGMKYTVVAFGL